MSILATAPEVSEIEERRIQLSRQVSNSREAQWLHALNQLTTTIFIQCHELCIARTFNKKSFLSFDHYSGIFVHENFFLNVFKYDFELDDYYPRINVQDLSSCDFVYCFGYGNSNQTLKDAVDSKSLSLSTNIPTMLKNAGFSCAWETTHLNLTPSLFFWKQN
jgi:hypothetical protein